MAFYYVHHSGRFDRTPQALVAGFENDRVNHKAEIIAFTEVDAENRFNALKNHATEIGWEFYRPGETQDDVAFVWNPRTFEFIKGYGKILSSIKTYSTTGHLLKPFAGTFVVLRRRADDKRYLFASCHTPSHVDAGHWRTKNGKKTNRVRQYIEGMRNLNKEVNRALKAYRINGGRVISADFNINLKALWARTFLKATFPAFRLNKDKDNQNTLGHRRIDGLLMGKRVRQAGDTHVWVAVDSDHHTIGVALD